MRVLRELAYTLGMTSRLLPLAIALVLTSCSDPAADKKYRAERVAKRMEAADAILSKTPVPRSYRIDGNELKVIDVPIKDGSGYLDNQRCFVWRDAEFKSATLSCGQMPEIVLPAQPDVR